MSPLRPGRQPHPHWADQQDWREHRLGDCRKRGASSALTVTLPDLPPTITLPAPARWGFADLLAQNLRRALGLVTQGHGILLTEVGHEP